MAAGTIITDAVLKTTLNIEATGTASVKDVAPYIQAQEEAALLRSDAILGAAVSARLKTPQAGDNAAWANVYAESVTRLAYVIASPRLSFRLAEGGGFIAQIGSDPGREDLVPADAVRRMMREIEGQATQALEDLAAVVNAQIQSEATVEDTSATAAIWFA